MNKEINRHLIALTFDNLFAERYMFIPLSERKGKLPARRPQRCHYLAYFYTTVLVPMYGI